MDLTEKWDSTASSARRTVPFFSYWQSQGWATFEVTAAFRQCMMIGSDNWYAAGAVVSAKSVK